MSDELRECPFCGFNGVEVKGNDLRGWFCECPQCWGGIKDHCASEAEAAEDWNTRPVEDALRAEVLRLNAQYYEMETYGCPDCNGDGEIKGNTCFTCNGHGVLYVKPNEAAE